MANRFDVEKIHQVGLKMVTKENWLKWKTKKKDLICPDCKRQLAYLETDIALMTIHGQLNTHLCEDCGIKYIGLGAIDINKSIEERKSLIDEIQKTLNDNGLKLYPEEFFKEKTIDMLKPILVKVKEDVESELEYRRKLEDDKVRHSAEDWKIEQYLIDDYNVFQDENYLTSHLEIEEYFLSEDSSDMFECGQGFAQDTEVRIVKIGKEFYEVTITAEIGSAKQDRGERLYWVESIESVLYKKIEKPLKKKVLTKTYTVSVNNDKMKLIEDFFKENKIDWS